MADITEKDLAEEAAKMSTTEEAAKMLTTEEAAKMSTTITPSDLQEGNLPEQEMVHQPQQTSNNQPANEGVVTTEGISEPQAQTLGKVVFLGDVPDECTNATVNAEPDAPISGMWQHSRDYVEHLLCTLNQQRAEGIHCDFSVNVSGTGFPVHKCVISAASPYFYQRTREAEAQLSSVIVLDQISKSCFSQLLDFIYIGKAFIDKDSVKDLENAAEVFQIAELQALCKSYTTDKDSTQENQKAPEGSSESPDLVLCKKEPPDSEEFGKTLRALNDNLTNDSELMTSLIENQNSVISEILAKLKDVPSAKPGRGRRKGTPRRKASSKAAAAQETKNNTKQPVKPKKDPVKKDDKKSKKIKAEPAECKADLKEINDLSNAIHDDDIDNDPSFMDDYDDDEDETYEPGGPNKRRKRRLSSRNIRTGKVLRSAKKLKMTSAKPKEKREPKEKKKRKERKGRVMAIDLLKEKLETLNVEELADLGIRRLGDHETVDPTDCPYAVIGEEGKTIDISSLPVDDLPPVKVQSMPLPAELIGNGITVPSSLLVSPSSQDNSPKGNYCVYCNSSFKSKEALLIHKEQAHRNIRCEHCNKLFIRQEHLSRHINKEHVKIFPDLICKECNKEFKFTKKYMKHMEEAHNVAKPFTCQFEGCTSKFRNINQLGHHHNTHTTERNLVCPTCGNTYRTKETLLCHMQRCRNIRDKLCDTCGAAFTNNQDLRQHIQIMHSGLRLYVCAVCGKDFSCPSNLRRHKRIHDNAFPYKCNCCPASFRYSNTLKHHLQNKHNMQPPANSIIFRERKQGGRPPGDHPGAGNRRKTIEAANICRFPAKMPDHRVRSHDQTGPGGVQVARTLAQTDHPHDPTHITPVDANGAGPRVLDCEINAAVQSINAAVQSIESDNNSSNGGNYTMASTLPPLAVMPAYRNQATSAHINLGASSNPGAPSWPVAGAPPSANMAAMLNAESATSSMIQHAHAMSALYHTPWGMGQH